ncbi:MAG: hypothetical protein ACPG31_01740 [Planctomycetota bacterium]
MSGRIMLVVLMATPPPSKHQHDAEPRRAWMGEEEFAVQLAETGSSFRAAVEKLRQRPITEWTERSLYLLSLEARTLERFLDAHGAQGNNTFYPVRKSLAMCLWLSQALSCLVHLQGRLRVYPTANQEWTETTLPGQLHETVNGLGQLLEQSLKTLVTQWVKSGSEWNEVHDTHLFMVPPATRILAADRRHQEDRESSEEGGSPIPRLAGRFLDFAASWHRKAKSGLADPAAQLEFAKDYCRERTTRSFQARAHNWQSDYDSMIRGSQKEEEDPRLLCLRGAMSQSLHLLEASTALAHLYERHRPKAQPQSGEEEGFAICNFLRGHAFLKLWIQGCVVRAHQCLEQAAETASAIVRDYCEISSMSLTLPEGVQWHARPLTLVVGVVIHHGVPVTMEIEGQEAPANSLIQMLLLVGAHPDSREVTFRGDVRALTDLEHLFEAKLGEEGLEEFPGELAYLS